ncbi:Protein of unknown function (DUF3099) [Frankia sp. EI5c]|uniref:DUF3099 domain-containing protein n=1 Tax=Frankia sp. EI5c TaxID=683316 RepID=UPI0007C3040E|nr:DUF3099 domain-containing protein [Frankia sp. EI5c]OAA25422.1 Protein of unknown function (DUF3099) [Frankia sp. EI5c]
MDVKWRRDEPILITSAVEARPEEIRRRERRYILTMLFRVVCFVLAVVVFSGWLRIVAVGLAVILPWIAVVVANGGPPQSARRQAGFVEKDPATPDPLVLSAGHTIVDAEPAEPAEPAGPADSAGPADAARMVIDAVVLASVEADPQDGSGAPTAREAAAGEPPPAEGPRR